MLVFSLFPQLSWNWSVACLCCLHVCLLLEAGRMGREWWTQNQREWSRKGMAGSPAHSLLLRTGNLTTYTVSYLCSPLSLGRCWGRGGEGMVLHFDLEEAARMPTPPFLLGEAGEKIAQARWDHLA